MPCFFISSLNPSLQNPSTAKDRKDRANSKRCCSTVATYLYDAAGLIVLTWKREEEERKTECAVEQSPLLQNLLILLRVV
jgi:hypothetical protein